MAETEQTAIVTDEEPQWIVTGPSKFALLCLALGDGQTVEFVVGEYPAQVLDADGRPTGKWTGVTQVEVAIANVSREDGAEGFEFFGTIPGTPSVLLDGGRAVTPRVEGYVVPDRNEGWLRRGVIR